MSDALDECISLSEASEQDTLLDKGKESRRKKRKIMKSLKFSLKRRMPGMHRFWLVSQRGARP